MRAAIIENSPTAPLGLLAAALERRGFALQTLPGPELASHREALDRADLIVSLGSPKAVYDGDAWIRWQTAYVADAVQADRAVLGICFGAQILAAAVGGSVTATGTLHVGWSEIADARAPVWQGPWVRWHGDHVRLPPGAEVLARADDTIQAFAVRRAVGVQFHPEADAGCVTTWMGSTPPAHLAGLDGPALIALTRARESSHAGLREALLNEVLRRCGLATAVPASA